VALGPLSQGLRLVPASEMVSAALVAGITLTPNQRARAQTIIATTYYEQRALGPIASCLGWKMLVALRDQRDSALRAMLASDSDKAKFDRHAAAAHPGPCVPRE